MHWRKLAPILGTALAATCAAALAGCDRGDVTIDGEHGQRLADLDLSGPPPHGLALMGVDRVDITRGDKLAIRIEGDAGEADRLRFTLKDGTLGILRAHGFLNGNATPVTIHVTMPAPDALTVGGTGSIHADALASDHAEVTIAGTGQIATPAVAARHLEVNIAGTGDYRAAGAAATLELNLIGTGNAAMDALHVETAKVTVAGAGNGSFASDGKVAASIVGPGSVRVHGRATCTVSAIGPGTLVCDHGATAAASKDDG